MGMQAVYNSWIRKPQQYLKTRFPARLYLPCATFLVIAGLASGRTLPPVGLALAWVLAFTLLLQFRLLDDLSDVAHDRRVYPERVLSQAVSLVPFYVLLCICLLANFVLVAVQPGPRHRFVALLLLNAGAFLWHYGLRRILTGKVMGYHIVIGKYPLFVFLLSGDGRDRWRLLLAMAAVYLCFSMYEALHDRSLHTTPRAATSLTLEIGALFAVSVLMTSEMIGGNPSIVILQGLLGVVSLLALSEMFCRRRVHLDSAKTGYAVFILGFALILNFSVGVRL
jgi:4-hydroxybenzoate polyprenyltransferase